MEKYDSNKDIAKYQKFKVKDTHCERGRILWIICELISQFRKDGNYMRILFIAYLYQNVESQLVWFFPFLASLFSEFFYPARFMVFYILLNQLYWLGRVLRIVEHK